MAEKENEDKGGIITDKTELNGLLKLLEPIKSFGINKIAELSGTVTCYLTGCYLTGTMETKCYDELPEMMCYVMTSPGEFGTDDDGGDDDGGFDFDTDDDDDVDFDELFGFDDDDDGDDKKN